MTLPCDDHELTSRCAFKKIRRVNTPLGLLPLREYHCHYCHH
nr:hypothetical protein [Tanacetum cinerariifolium]